MPKGKRRRYGPTFEKRQAAGTKHAYELAVYAGVSVRVIDTLEFMDKKRLGKLRLSELVLVADALQCAPLDLVPGLAISADRWRKKYAQTRIGKDAPPAVPVREDAALPPEDAATIREG